MFCSLDSCGKVSKFEALANNDCFVKHVLMIKQEMDKMLSHYGALQKSYKFVATERDKVQKKYKDLKAKRRKTSASSTDSRSDTPMQADLLNSPKLFKTLAQRSSFGKENSPSKSPTKSSMALSFSRLGEEFKNLPKHTSPKSLKQVKLSFGKSKAKKGKVQETGKDSTFCEVLEKKKVASAWISTSILEQSSDALTVRTKKTSPTQRSAQSSVLFDFQQPMAKRVSSTDVRRKTENLDETPNISLIEKIKEEKLSESDLDIFGSDGESSQGSSVMFIEPLVEPPIIIQENTLHSDDALLASLEREFLNQTQNDESPPAPSSAPPRKRKRIYGECHECREFYDRFAEINGPTQSETHIRICPQKCKAFTYKKREAQPKQPRPPLPPPQIDTPEGYWDIPFTAEDPDKTQDGL